MGTHADLLPPERSAEHPVVGALVDHTLDTFEWLTNFDSLSHLLDQEYLFRSGSSSSSPRTKKRRVLHVGCGTSIVGEGLVGALDYDFVLNIDKDDSMVAEMQSRTSFPCRCKYQQLDLNDESACRDAKLGEVPFDLVVDKSTLDCLLCSDASGLLCEVYHSLCEGGVYFVCSFHSKELILPLLQYPGMQWDIICTSINRVVERVSNNQSTSNQFQHNEISNIQDGCNKSKESVNNSELRPATNQSAWNDGTFMPNSTYGKTVNIFICRKNQDLCKAEAPEDLSFQCDRAAVRDHLHKVNDKWFQKVNPMLTHTREVTLRRLFTENGGDDCGLPLARAYAVIFTAAEREHLTFDLFLEDWSVFSENQDGSVCSTDFMSIDVALKFLKEMQ
mmetsp:Transcript_17593/g.27403  ORF Transcript_17593/g.27403 Transcript_17593/m.27403 type:complete len:390 (+) Transcript_17593:160-1329(+)|eukprot:CAMPEP_0196802722 /NCGR_PEP_ID=MMETSP1362-20130617/2294_1 /TAXON_ID=163516 /ORGANISM="Leptocylindrus danicus, Strain CCMP1856" /LENGTH=389 /DNA_ID=CAMNT_0042174099 /DNA_START=110 /DNA_END=1279 /DNA_ORIENTATION=+